MTGVTGGSGGGDNHDRVNVLNSTLLGISILIPILRTVSVYAVFRELIV